MSEKERVYGKWAGNPSGYPEDKSRCSVEVFNDVFPHQCLRKRGAGRKGDLCKQHAKMLGESNP